MSEYVQGGMEAHSMAQGTVDAATDVVKPLIPGMRALLYVASFLVLGVGTILTLLPQQTDQFFAWTVNPPLTAAFLGAAYLASFVIEFMSARQTAWARARVAVPAVLTFTTLTLVATLLHFDRFHFGSSFEIGPQIFAWVWTAIYVGVPPVMSVLLVLQLRAPGGDPPRVAPLETWVRVVLVAQGAVMLILGIGLFLAPTVFASMWPWQLTPLTGRAIGAWLVGLGIATLHANWENDWLRGFPASVSYTALGVLQLIALARFGDAVAWGSASTWVYLLFLVSVPAIGVYGLVRVRRI
jgi:hypothetical protein